MSGFDFDTPIDRRNTPSEKWRRYAGRDVLPFWVADMDFASPPCVVDALHAAVDHRVFGYGSVPEGMVNAVSTYLAKQHGLAVDPRWLVWLPGLVGALSVAARSVGAPGDAVATFTPVYPPFLGAHRDADKTLVTLPLARDPSGTRWTFDLPALDRALTPAVKLLLLCHPHNPVGRVWTRAELEPVLDLCAARGVVVCSDEIHCDLILDATTTPHHTVAGFEGRRGLRTITLMAPSKTFNIAGLGLSFAIIPDDSLRRAFKLAKGRLVPFPNWLAFYAGEAAYRHGEPWRQALLAYLRDNHALVRERLARDLPGLAADPVEATYLAWLDARAAGGDDPHARFEAAGAGLSDGRDFGAPGWVRLNFGCPRAMLAEGLDRMARALAKG